MSIRTDFAIYGREPDLVYLDSAATALKPESVVDAMDQYYRAYTANVGRGLYPTAERSTLAYEDARAIVSRFIGADETHTIVFTANATHAINLVSLGLEEKITNEHSIIVTALEHHSNYLPWKELTKRKSARFIVAPFERSGKIDPARIGELVDTSTAVVAFSAVSNVFGIINPVAEIIAAIRKKNPKVLVLVDSCQAVGHIPVDIKEWDADFIVFSGHKLYGPTGIGVLAGKKSSLEQLAPKNVGGGTVLDATCLETSYRDLPERLEGGTPNIAGAIGLGAAIEYINTLDTRSIREHERSLMTYTLRRLKEVFGNRIDFLGDTSPSDRAGLVSFTLTGIHPHDLAQILGEEGVCVRAGEQCAGPLHRSLEVPASTRVSLSIYNTEGDIDRLIAGMEKALGIIGQPL